MTKSQLCDKHVSKALFIKLMEFTNNQDEIGKTVRVKSFQISLSVPCLVSAVLFKPPFNIFSHFSDEVVGGCLSKISNS